MPKYDLSTLSEIKDLDDPRLYINRELSMLEFQKRVLEEAQDDKNPLLERVKFLAIVGLNLDEFFMVRVGGLKMQLDAGVIERSIDGLSPAEQLAEIRKKSYEIMVDLRSCFQTQLIPRLKNAGVHLMDYSELNEQQKDSVNHYFEEMVFPVLTPLAFDPGHPFPHISNLSLNLAVIVQGDDGKLHFARIKVPDTLPRLVPLKRSSGSVRRDGTVPYNHYFVWLEQIIAANLELLFPGMQIIDAHPFRVTRNADFEIQELEAMDLLETMEQSVRQRRFGDVVRLSINNSMPANILDLLFENLEVDQNDTYRFDGPLGLSDLMSLLSIDRYDLKDIPFIPAIPKLLKTEGYDGNLFKAIRENDILVHHPYNSFEPVIQFLRQASKDTNVLAIKQTLYRVGRNSPIVRTLLEAQENRKQVAVMVELKARFDEESNIGWARMLEREGVHVAYGLVGLKTHAKIALVIRREGERIRRYVHLATGNYNAVTAHLYEDIGMFTCDDDIGMDATDLFNYLTGYSAKKTYRKLLVAPINLRERFFEMIRREIEHQRQGHQGQLIFKCNAIVDKPMIRMLYEASQAGVQIDLLVRGVCAVRPGIPGISENIRVRSVVGRFLEHSRIYYFRNGGNEEIYLGSADLMPRNINRRVEALFPVKDPQMIRYLRNDVLTVNLKDNMRARLMKPDGTYERLKPKSNETQTDIQSWLLHFHLDGERPHRVSLRTTPKKKKV
jgi:polyphosphate kinase